MEGRAATLELLGTNETEVAYIAGLFDGEGCVSAKKTQTNHGSRQTVSIQVDMTTPEPLYRCQRIFGGKVVPSQQRYGWSTLYYWRLGSKKAEFFLRVIEPYLIIKREQANLAITFLNCGWGRLALKAKLGEEITRLKTRAKNINPDEPNAHQC